MTDQLYTPDELVERLRDNGENTHQCYWNNLAADMIEQLAARVEGVEKAKGLEQLEEALHDLRSER